MADDHDADDVGSIRPSAAPAVGGVTRSVLFEADGPAADRADRPGGVDRRAVPAPRPEPTMRLDRIDALIAAHVAPVGHDDKIGRDTPAGTSASTPSGSSSGTSGARGVGPGPDPATGLTGPSVAGERGRRGTFVALAFALAIGGVAAVEIVRSPAEVVNVASGAGTRSLSAPSTVPAPGAIDDRVRATLQPSTTAARPEGPARQDREGRLDRLATSSTTEPPTTTTTAPPSTTTTVASTTEPSPSTTASSSTTSSSDPSSTTVPSTTVPPSSTTSSSVSSSTTSPTSSSTTTSTTAPTTTTTAPPSTTAAG